MSFDLGKLFIDWRRIVPNGVPNPGNDYHLVLLKEICLKRGMDIDVVDNVILALEQDEKIPDDTPIKYKLKNKNTGEMEDKETTYGSAIQMKKEHPAYIAAKALQSDDKEDDKKEPEDTSGKIPPKDFQSDPEKGGEYMTSKSGAGLSYTYKIYQRRIRKAQNI